jgi:hypothetical protein
MALESRGPLLDHQLVKDGVSSLDPLENLALYNFLDFACVLYVGGFQFTILHALQFIQLKKTLWKLQRILYYHVVKQLMNCLSPPLTASGIQQQMLSAKFVTLLVSYQLHLCKHLSKKKKIVINFICLNKPLCARTFLFDRNRSALSHILI